MRSRRSRTLLFCLLVGARCLSAAEKPAPAATWSADLAKHLFATPEVERRARVQLETALGGLGGFRGRLGSDGRSLLAGLRADEEVLRIHRRHAAYLHLRCAMNQEERSSCADEGALDARVSAATAFVISEIGRIPRGKISAILRKEPALSAYRFVIAEARRQSAHLLDLPREELLDGLEPYLTGWQASLRSDLIGRIRFGSVETPAGLLDARRDRNLIATSPDRNARQRGFRFFWEGMSSQRDLLAFSLLHLATACNEVARLHGFADAQAQYDFEMLFEPGHTRKMLEAVSAHGGLLKRYESLRSADVKPSLGSEPPGPWDQGVPPGELSPIPLEDVGHILHDALAGLGPTLQRELDDLLDPGSGRADIGAGHRGRALTGFSVGYPGTTGILYVGSFRGTFKDLSVVAHEGTHAAHRNLMNTHGVRPLNAQGPSFLSESFAIFSELVLADWMAAHAPNAPLARYYREQFLAIKGLDLLRGANDGAVEAALYDHASDGSLRGPDDLDRLTLAIDEGFSIWPSRHPELRARWTALSLAWDDPFYNVNYMYAGLLALEYFQLYERRREWFVPRYAALLENGFDDTPANLLRRFLEIDMAAPGLVNDAASLLDRRLEALESSR